MKHIIPLGSADTVDSSFFGGKAHALNALACAGFPVPRGILVSASLCDSTSLEVRKSLVHQILSDLDYDSRETIIVAARKLQDTMKDISLPDEIKTLLEDKVSYLKAGLFAVRSSATVEDGKQNSWAGQFDTYLNIPPKDIINAVMKCQKSLYTPHALMYARAKGISYEDVSMGVVIQEMISGDFFGVAFSEDPYKKGSEEEDVIIEVFEGDADLISNAYHEADTYKFKKSLIHKNLTNLYVDVAHCDKKADPEGAIFSEIMLVELSALVVEIESFLGYPCDIEWVFADGRFFVLQARPITS